MTSHSANRQQRFLPYRFVEHGVGVQLGRCWFERERSVGVSADQDRHLLDLSAQRFEQVSLELTAKAPPELLADVLPPGERVAPPVRVLALVRCEATRLRTAVELARASALTATYAGVVTLPRRELAGTLELTVLLVRTAAALVPVDGWASAAGERLASARTWEVRIDAGRPPAGEYLETRQEDFQLAGPLRFPVPQALYQLDCEGEAPILWLNTGHATLVNILHSTANVGRSARLREAVFERIELSVWLQLILRSARDVLRLGEAETAPWQRAVLQKWLPSLYPEAGNHGARLDAMLDELDGGDGLFLQRIDLALQRELKTARTFAALAEELEP